MDVKQGDFVRIADDRAAPKGYKPDYWAVWLVLEDGALSQLTLGITHSLEERFADWRKLGYRVIERWRNIPIEKGCEIGWTETYGEIPDGCNWHKGNGWKQTSNVSGVSHLCSFCHGFFDPEANRPIQVGDEVQCGCYEHENMPYQFVVYDIHDGYAYSHFPSIGHDASRCRLIRTAEQIGAEKQELQPPPRYDKVYEDAVARMEKQGEKCHWCGGSKRIMTVVKVACPDISCAKCGLNLYCGYGAIQRPCPICTGRKPVVCEDESGFSAGAGVG